MSKLYEQDHAPTVAQALRISLLRLTPHAELADIRGRLAAQREALDAAMDAVEAADDAVVGQNMQIAFEDRQVDRLVAQAARLKRAGIADARPDRNPSFRDLFPEAPSDATKGVADDRQAHYVAHVLEAMGRPEHADVATQLAAPLAAQNAKLAAAVARRAELERAAALARTAMERAADAARRAFNEAQLDAAAATHDEAFVASLFDFRARAPRGGQPG